MSREFSHVSSASLCQVKKAKPVLCSIGRSIPRRSKDKILGAPESTSGSLC